MAVTTGQEVSVSARGENTVNSLTMLANTVRGPSPKVHDSCTRLASGFRRGYGMG